MTDIPVELCHCGQVLHYTDPVAKDFTLQMIESLGPTVKVQVPVDGVPRVWEVQRHYIALHGLKAAELPTLGFPEVTEEVQPDVGVSIGPEGALEAVPGPQEAPYDDETLLASDEAGLPSSEPTEAATREAWQTTVQPKSPMRSKAPTFGKRVCKVCLEEVSVSNYAEHVVGHGMAEVVAKWESGITGFLDDLQAALSQAMDEAQGFPEVQETIQSSQQLIRMLTQAMMASKRKEN
jgi:hypothetical protein